MADETKNPIDEKQQLIADFMSIANTDAGANVIRGLSKFCGENENPYVQGSFDRTSQKCGKLSVMYFIRKMLASDGLPKQQKVKTEKER